MIPCLYDQTEFYNEELGKRGNCMSACLATVLQIDIRLVPFFATFELGEWMELLAEWLKFGGWQWNYESGAPYEEAPKDQLYMGNGFSRRGIGHSVVMLNGEMFHDPHPSRTGIGEVHTIWWFTRIEK